VLDVTAMVITVTVWMMCNRTNVQELLLFEFERMFAV